MQLIGKLDSPYVRRVAISLTLLGIPFEHRSLSVFRDLEKFRSINPVVKAPTLVCNDGTVLMDSALILDYAETLAPAGRRLMPAAIQARQQALRIIGLAIAAVEKSIQIYYERTQRPAEKQHQPWVERAQWQINAAYAELERELAGKPLTFDSQNIMQADISLAVVWQFVLAQLPELVDATRYPSLAALATHAEALPEFQRYFPNE